MVALNNGVTVNIYGKAVVAYTHLGSPGAARKNEKAAAATLLCYIWRKNLKTCCDVVWLPASTYLSELLYSIASPISPVNTGRRRKARAQGGSPPPATKAACARVDLLAKGAPRRLGGCCAAASKRTARMALSAVNATRKTYLLRLASWWRHAS